MERQWRTLKGRWLYSLDPSRITSLAQFDGMLKDYMRTYNTTVHSGINCTPLERFRNTKDHPRIPESRQWLDNCFFNRVNRKVRKDATVCIDKISYDCPMHSFLPVLRSVSFQMTWILLLSFMRANDSLSVKRTKWRTVIPNATTALLWTTQRLEADHDL